MHGITDITYVLGRNSVSNFDRAERYDVTESFVRDKIGVLSVRQKDTGEETSDLAVAACEEMFGKGDVCKEDVECLVVVSQNPDGFGLPHMSAIMHGKMGLPERCACFDVSLGCSGFVYGLSVISSFMQMNGLQTGMLVTADNYSKIVDENDRDTAMLFGDGAAATLITDKPVWQAGKFDFGTIGALHEHLQTQHERCLHMNGREVFSFSAKYIPASIERVLMLNGCSMEDIDKVILHQGSKYIVDAISKRIKATDKTAFYASEYGNTVSSSIPIALAEGLSKDDAKLLISGFGVGMSWSTTVLSRVA